MLRDSEKLQLDSELTLKKILQKDKEAVYKQQAMLETTEPGSQVLWKKLIIIFALQHTTILRNRGSRGNLDPALDNHVASVTPTTNSR